MNTSPILSQNFLAEREIMEKGCGSLMNLGYEHNLYLRKQERFFEKGKDNRKVFGWLIRRQEKEKRKKRKFWGSNGSVRRVQ